MDGVLYSSDSAASVADVALLEGSTLGSSADLKRDLRLSIRIRGGRERSRDG